MLFILLFILSRYTWDHLSKNRRKLQQKSEIIFQYISSREYDEVERNKSRQMLGVRFRCGILWGLTIDSERTKQCNFCSRICSYYWSTKVMWVVACFVFRWKWKRNFRRPLANQDECCPMLYYIWNDRG